MSGFSSSREQLLTSLTHYTTVLESKKKALMQLSHTSEQMKICLESSEEPDIGAMLHKREQECKMFAHVCKQEPMDVDALISFAASIASGKNDEAGDLARSLINIHNDSKTLADSILHCQLECETLLKNRLEVEGNAIKRSTERRKLDAVYGPAVKHCSPVYLDRQQ